MESVGGGIGDRRSGSGGAPDGAAGIGIGIGEPRPTVILSDSEGSQYASKVMPLALNTSQRGGAFLYSRRGLRPLVAEGRMASIGPAALGAKGCGRRRGGAKRALFYRKGAFFLWNGAEYCGIGSPWASWPITYSFNFESDSATIEKIGKGDDVCPR